MCATRSVDVYHSVIFFFNSVPLLGSCGPNIKGWLNSSIPWTDERSTFHGDVYGQRVTYLMDQTFTSAGIVNFTTLLTECHTYIFFAGGGGGGGGGDLGAILYVQYIPRNMHTVFALLCFVVVIHWLIFPYPSGLLHWHYGNLTIAPVPVKQPWWIWINTSCEFIMNDCITTTKQSTTKSCAYFLGYTVR